MCLYRNDVSPIWKICSKSYKKNKKNRIKRKIVNRNRGSSLKVSINISNCSRKNKNRRLKKKKSQRKQTNVSFIREMLILNELVVSLLADKNRLIVIILPILLMYDILLMVCSLIEIYHILIINIIIDIKIGKEIELLKSFNNNAKDIMRKIDMLALEDLSFNKDDKDFEFMRDKASSTSRVINRMKSGLIEAISIAPCYFNSESINYELACLIINYSVILVEAERHVSNRSFLKKVIREVGGGEKRNRSKPDRFMNTQDLNEKNFNKRLKTKSSFQKNSKRWKDRKKSRKGAGRKDKAGQQKSKGKVQSGFSMSEDEEEISWNESDFNQNVQMGKRSRETKSPNLRKDKKNNNQNNKDNDNYNDNESIDSESIDNENDNYDNEYIDIDNNNDNDKEKLDDDGYCDLGEFTSSLGESILHQKPHNYVYPDDI